MFRKRVQLGLIHSAVAMTLVPINSTLNRIMIKELALSALLVATLASLPYLLSPIQVAIGSFSDRHPILGWKRTPYIIVGLLLCVAGVLLAPRIAYLLADNMSLGLLVGVIVFGLWGMGYNLATVSYFSMATELSGSEGRSRTIAVMFVMMIVSIILTSLTLGQLLENYTPGILIRSFTYVGLTALVLGFVGTIGLESRSLPTGAMADETYGWGLMLKTLTSNPQAKLFFVYLLLLLTAILGQDILLEPFGAEAFGLSVQSTTRITSIWGGAFLVSMSLGAAMDKRVPKMVQARIGAWGAISAFSLIVISGVVDLPWVFYLGVVLLGFATGISTVSNLSLMLDMTAGGNVGLYIGAWGMASALARFGGNMLSGMIRDAVTSLSHKAAVGYSAVFLIEILFLAVSLVILGRIDINIFQRQANHATYLERATIAGEVS